MYCLTTPKKVIVMHFALRYVSRMKTTSTLNVRLTDRDSEVLEIYSEQVGMSQSDVIRSYIRELSVKLCRPTAEDVDPMLLPSLPLYMRKRTPDTPCVYFFLSSTGDVLYIGHASNLKKRLSNHHQYDDAISADENSRVHWVEIRTKSALLKFESKCVARFTPPLNKVNP